MNWKPYESLTHLQQELEKFIELQTRKNEQIALSFATEDKKRIYAIGSLDVLKYLTKEVALPSADTHEG